MATEESPKHPRRDAAGEERAQTAAQSMPTATCTEQVVGDSDAPSRFGCKRGLREGRSEGSARVCAPQC